MFKESKLLILIIALALFLRFFKLGEIPVSFNPDEAALGYNSFALLKTGADEHGKFLPLSLQSFGDWKLPIYSYASIFPIALFGLNEWTVRLPSAIASVVGVLLIYKISYILFQRRAIAILSSLFFALSPWSIYFSRAAYEVNLATTFFLGGLVFFLSYIYSREKYTKLIIASFILLALTMFTQHNYIIFAPLFVLTILYIFKKNIKYNRPFLGGIILFGLFICVSYVSLAHGGSKKISNLNVFNNKSILYSRVEKLRGDAAPKNEFFNRILHTKYLGVTYQIGQNYINSFSPMFLFDKGGEKLVHNIGDVGYFYLFDVFLLLVGFAGLFWNKEKSLKILLPWLLLAPIASAVTTDAPNATRLFTFMPPLILVISYGAGQIISSLAKSRSKALLFGGLLVLFYALHVVYFLDYYFIHFNHQRIRFWNYGYKQAVELAQKYPRYKVVMTGPENFPYIYFLFYEQYDPKRFRSEVEYYPPTSEGFYFVKKFGRFQFVDKIDYGDVQKGAIYIDNRSPENMEGVIRLPSGEAILGYRIVD